jgi:hypothetical protein
MKTKLASLVGLIVGLLLMPMVVSADIITFELINGNTILSAFPGPYAKIQVDLDSTGTVATITEYAYALSPNSSGYKYGIVDGGSLALNINGDFNPILVTDLSGKVVIGGADYTGPWKTNDPVEYNTPVDGIGTYDLAINMKNSNIPLSELTVKVVKSSGMWSSADQVLALDSGQIALAGGHFAVLNSDGTSTGTTGYASSVPIPAAAWLLGTGLVGLVGIRRRMRK